MREHAPRPVIGDAGFSISERIVADGKNRDPMRYVSIEIVWDERTIVTVKRDETPELDEQAQKLRMRDETLAVAKIVAAAPAQLEACKAATDYYEMLERATGVEHGVLKTLRAAIAKATNGKGEQ